MRSSTATKDDSGEPFFAAGVALTVERSGIGASSGLRAVEQVTVRGSTSAITVPVSHTPFRSQVAGQRTFQMKQ